eukprot:15465836-Alexandrium_andersonii.AAC.1
MPTQPRADPWVASGAQIINPLGSLEKASAQGIAICGMPSEPAQSPCSCSSAQRRWAYRSAVSAPPGDWQWP